MARKYSSTPQGGIGSGFPLTFLSIQPGSDGSIVRITRIMLGQTDVSPAVAQNCTVNWQRWVGSAISSGPTTSLTSPLDPGDPIPAAVINWNSDVPTGGVAVPFGGAPFYLAQGLDMVFDAPLVISGTQIITFAFGAAFTGGVAMGAVIYWEEEGGTLGQLG